MASLTRFGLLAVAVMAAMLLLSRDAQAFSGAELRGSSFLVRYGDADALPRIGCPGGTTSTGRPGDFSFCTGSMSLFRGGRLVGRGLFSIRTFDSHIERIHLFPAGRALVRTKRPITFSYRLDSHDGTGASATRTGSVTFRDPYR